MRVEIITENLIRIRDRMETAARLAGRNAREITLIGVSKMHPAASVRAAFAAGITHFGENRVQEWEGKRGELVDIPGQWHLIGHLQSNKASRAANYFHAVDSVDDFALAQRLDRARTELPGAAKLRVLIEVHLANEESKSGVDPAGLPRLAQQVAELPHLRLTGLMCIPPFLDNPEKVRPYFAKLRVLRDDLSSRLGMELPVLSMGMSHDFEVAIEEGATEVRLGTALFGARKTSNL